MARRIVFVRQNSYHPNLQNMLRVDARVKVDWKYQAKIDLQSGDPYIDEPNFEVVSFWDEIGNCLPLGYIIEDSDKEWIKKSTEQSIKDNGFKPPSFISRIHAINILNHENFRGFEIEIITGNDAKNFQFSEDIFGFINLVKENWFIFILAAVLFYIFI